MTDTDGVFGETLPEMALIQTALCYLMARHTLRPCLGLACTVIHHPRMLLAHPDMVDRTFAGNFDRHTRENGYPAFSTAYWIPACAGTTESESPG